LRSDLAYRVAGVEIVVPPLRARRSDILLLAERFLEGLGSTTGRLEPEAVSVLREHLWPGNVRELRTVIERLAVLVAEGPITAAAVWAQLAASSRGRDPSPGRRPSAHQLRDLLGAHGWNVSAVANVLGIARSTLYLRLQRLGITRPAGVRGECPMDMDRLSDRTPWRALVTP
jgi:propionate catabolism operon transcriptional regulator